jgi:hypothetical protein
MLQVLFQSTAGRRTSAIKAVSFVLRSFSSNPPSIPATTSLQQQKISKLSLDALIGISDTVLLYLVSAKPGEELEALQKEKSSLGTRWRKMTEVLGKFARTGNCREASLSD